MLSAVLLFLAAAQMTFPSGTAEDPSAVAPLSPTTSPVRFWWDKAAFHAGHRVYPWSELGTDPTNGATFKIDFGVIDRTGFDRRKIVLEGTLDTTVSKYRFGPFGAIGNRPISNDVVLVAAKDGTANCAFSTECAAPNFARFNRFQKAKTGETVRIPIRAQGSTSGTAACALTDTDGRRIYRIDGPYRDPLLGFDFRFLWTDVPKRLLHVVTDVWQDAPGCRIRLTSSDLLTREPRSWTKTIDVAPAWGKQDYALSVDDLPPGLYLFKIEFLDPSGACVHTDKARYFKPGAKTPWDDTQLGNEDTVPPPWTPPVFGADTFECWNRRITFGGKGLVSSIISGGEEVLAEPATVFCDGRPLGFDVTQVDRKVSEATYHLKARCADVRVDVGCEFDGYMRFALTYPTTVSSLCWRVAGSTSVVRNIEGCANGNAVRTVGAGASFAEDFDAHRHPVWWMFGRAGLMGGTLNLHGYHMRDLSKTGRVVASDDRVTVTTTFVDEPMKAGPARTVLFYLEPTPVKPKDNSFASVAQDKLCLWTDYMFLQYEAKYPGLEVKANFDNLRKGLERGDRIFYYCSTIGASPESPFWGWYQQDWNKDGLGYYCREVPLSAQNRERRNWCYACPNAKSFLENKIWGVNYMLTRSEPMMKDLYFDLASLGTSCGNTCHGCRWWDEYSRLTQDLPLEKMREIHKRCYRLVKAKNPDGVLYGHTSGTRYPGDVFFDLLTMGESLDLQTYRHARRYRGVLSPTYYDVFTPEMILDRFVSRGCEKTVYMNPQFARALSCHAGAAAAAAFDPNLPEIQTAFRHFAAYVKIHDLNIDRGSPDNPEWRIYYLYDGAVRALGGARSHHAYYLPDDDAVTLSDPGPRQLWAAFSNASETVLIVLNDTDAPVRQTISVRGLSARGREILEGTEYDFSSGSCSIAFPPRGAVFIRFATGIGR